MEEEVKRVSDVSKLWLKSAKKMKEIFGEGGKKFEQRTV